MALAYVVSGWNVDDWVAGMKALAPDLDLRVWPDRLGNLDDITYALAWRPAPNVLKSFRNLKAIFSLGAGVDAILADPTLPDVPIVRVVDPDMTMRMSEYVCLHVLMHHRQQRKLDLLQAERRWAPSPQWAASAVRVGIMGLGELGRDAAQKLAHLGFKVSGWSNSRHAIRGVESYAGKAELDAFLKTTDILVCLLPHTPETEGILNRALFRKLASDSRLGAPVLINAGRGKLQVEADIIAALDAGELGGATLDVFQTEPLPADSPLWTHPKVTVTPHIAADSEPDVISAYIINQMRRHEAGRPFENLVDRARGY
jgi:glyoxylate/hydroxypyruvate reductase A